jgi:dihydrofolate synthase/folylpolyglutamate synthase
MSENPKTGKIKAAFDFLDQFTNYEREKQYPYNAAAMNLERVAKLLAPLGSPEKKLRAIHIAGTKGKGSTAKMIDSILSAAGLRVGLYTSPHLVWRNERIQVNDEMISDADFADAIDGLRKGVDAVHSSPELGEVSYFELITAAAFFQFAARKVDYAVLETGLGGRFDATNVCSPVVVVITPISFDHTDILGDTLAKIASEKAMIIKPKSKVVVSPQPKEAQEVIEKRALEMGAEIFGVEKHYSSKLNYIYGQEMSFDLAGRRTLAGLKTKMVGPHQMVNAAAAVLACDLLAEQGAKISDDTIRYGLARARLAARFQSVELSGRTIVLDGAHNRESAKALVETLRLVHPGKQYNFIMGLGQDKDIEGFLAEIKPSAQRIIFSRAHHPKAASGEQLKSKLGDFAGKVVIEPEIKDALGKVGSMTRPGEIIVITGSFFLIGEALAWLQKAETEIQIP